MNPQHVRRIADSMRQRNLMPYQPVITNEEMYVIDGQHRIEAAKMLKIDVHFIIIPNVDLATIRLLNANMKAWTARDFVESYSKTGNAHYTALLQFIDHYKIPLTAAAQILTDSLITLGGGKISTTIRNGSFEIKDLDGARKLMDFLKEIEPFTDAGVWRAREFMKAIVMLTKRGMKQKQLLDRFKRTGKHIKRMASAREYAFALADIYNHGLGSKNRLTIL